MPELPEVETICNKLRIGTEGQPSILGTTIHNATVLWPKTVAYPSSEQFQSLIVGQSILRIGRRGKYLLFHLSSDTLLIHLRMSGDIGIGLCHEEVAKHDRIVLNFEDGRRLAFNDPRKFGRAWLVADPQVVLANLGPEPLDLSFKVEDFYLRLQTYHRQVKPLLIDQKFIAGIGNIYADEALHLARINPKRLSDTLSLSQSERLLEGIRSVLREGIRRNGASIDWAYRGGDFQNYFRVHLRAGEACPECQTPIQKITVGQRGTYFCPTCQPI